jgi:transcriptional regulator with XRE-family HTH domain
MKPNLSTLDKTTISQEKRVFAEKIGSCLKKLRESRQLTQEELAYKAGYSRNMIGNVEQAVNSPTAHTLWRIARALDADVCDFFKNI